MAVFRINKVPLRPAQEVLKLRANLLVYLKQLVARQGTLLDAEMQALLNYLLVVEEDENLHDVLYLLITLLVDTPNAVGSTFIRNDALHVAFKRLSVLDESNRVYAIKLLGFHLHFSRIHKYDDLMDRYGLFDLMVERLHAVAPNLSVVTYNALFEVLINSISSRPQSAPKSLIAADTVIQQPQMIRVISELIYRSEKNAESTMVRQIFLQHLLSLCTQNTQNRRNSRFDTTLWNYNKWGRHQDQNERSMAYRFPGWGRADFPGGIRGRRGTGGDTNGPG
ncbi:unnamed protein product [Echinostoma caproni]|uniref:DUF4704 domain-containing protein n=1 Tax=Echinostoma caproni TaxID=27848 RepID=A0A183AUZ8_9TREM|nr:unnamed protein product [Echinostoma caproni]